MKIAICGVVILSGILAVNCFEAAPVKDRTLKMLGYSCQLTDDTVMRDREVIYTQCEATVCKEGTIFRDKCGLQDPGPNCKVVKGDSTQPYPRCCDQMVCSEVHVEYVDYAGDYTFDSGIFM